MRYVHFFSHTQKRSFLPYFLIICTLNLTLSACQKQPEEQSKTAVPSSHLEMIEQDLVAIKLGTSIQKTAFIGTIRAINQSSVQAQISATATQVHAQVGQKVKKGQLLVQLNNQDNAARLAQARANLSATQAQANLAKNMMQRKSRLLNQGFISRVEYEQSQVDYQAQLENVRAQQANVDIAEKANQDGAILSPISGIISQRQIEVGQTVAIGQTLFEIIDPDHLELQAKVPTDAQQSLKIGQPIEYVIQGNPNTFTATLSRVTPLADVTNRQIEFFAIPKEYLPALSIGSFVEGHILASQSIQGQMIPLDTVRDSHAKPYVWVVRDSKIQRIPVTLLEQRYNENIAIVQGLQSADRISRIQLNEADLNKTVKISKQ